MGRLGPVISSKAHPPGTPTVVRERVGRTLSLVGLGCNPSLSSPPSPSRPTWKYHALCSPWPYQRIAENGRSQEPTGAGRYWVLANPVSPICMLNTGRTARSRSRFSLPGHPTLYAVLRHVLVIPLSTGTLSPYRYI